ncbi:MAG TPA: asparagine synthase-related protein [Verrucomicrobiae bacterium]
MPGIAGIITRKPTPESVRSVQAMVAAMEAESFYVSGTFLASEVDLCVGWAMHENSFSGGKLLLSEKEDVILVFSGECFLDPRIGDDLRCAGHRIGSDKVSWLVHLYEQEGEQFFGKLNGLFSGLLIDKRQGKVFLFNDRYGVNRIYSHETEDGFYFANEARALLRLLPELRRFDEQGVAQFLTYGCPLEGRTLFHGVSLLPAGALWSFKNGTSVRRNYFSPESLESQPALSTEAFESAFQETFSRILPRYTDSQLKLGISLTAGLDTRMIMACLPEAGINAICYTYSGPTNVTLDARLAGRVAAACHLEHRILRIESDFFTDFAAWTDKTICATDGYFGITGAHEIYLSHQARQLSPVRLTGVAGGEILRGISTFKPLNLSSELLQPKMQSLINTEMEHSLELHDHPVTFAAFKEIPWNLYGPLMACRSQLCLRSPYMDNELVSLAYRAPKELRTSCASAVRFVRNNSRTMSDIPTDMGYLGTSGFGPLRRAASKASFKFDYFYSHGLPRAVSRLNPVFRRFAAITGVAGTHKYIVYGEWFRDQLAPFVKESLAEVQRRQSPFWNHHFLKDAVAGHISGGKNYVQEINAVLTLHAIERLLFKKSSLENGASGERPITVDKAIAVA